jgi:hypothetical protein
MTREQSTKLKVGIRVCFNGDRADRGMVTAIEPNYVTIKWEDGHRSYSGHKGMTRVDVLTAER